MGGNVTVLQTTNGQPYYFNFHATLEGEDSEGEKPLPIPWLSVSPVPVKRHLSTSSSARYKNMIPNPLSSSSIKTVVPRSSSELAAVLIWRWKAVSRPASTPSNAKIQRQMSNSSVAL